MKDRPEIKKDISNRFWDRKLVPSGHTRVLSVGRIIPHDWQIVRVWVLRQDEQQLELRVKRLV